MSSAQQSATLARDIEAICGSGNVRVDETSLRGRTIGGVTPQVIAAPANATETAGVLKCAAERDLVVVPAGSCSRQHIGRIPARVDIVIETARMNAIQYFEPGDLTIGIQAGAKLGDVVTRIEAHGQTLPIDPPSVSRTTIGSIVATCASGPLRHGYGSVRDFCLGVEFATAEGKVAKAGGRVVKNVAGYDVTKLLVGSYGTLAIITSANFRVFPSQRQTRTFIAQFKNLDDAIDARDYIVLRSPLTPLALELVSPGCLPQGTNDAWALILRAGGSDAVLGRYRQELGTMVSVEVEGERQGQLWKEIADFPDTLFAHSLQAIVLRVSAPQQRLGVIIAGAQQAAQPNGFTLTVAGRAVSPIYLAFVPGVERANYAAALNGVRATVGRDGVVTVTHCPTDVKRSVDVWGTSATDFEAIRSVKRTFDAGDILNRGRFLL